MNHDDLPFGDGSDAPFESARSDGEELLRRIDEDAEEIPVISHEMLHHERVDFEAGMKVFPPVTLVLMLACIVVYVRQVWVHGLDNTLRVVETGAMTRDEVLQGQLWRLISGGFMHANAEHLIGNLVMLFVLGMACEHAFGRGVFLFLYVAACVSGSLLTLATSLPTVGASGAIFGLAGAVLSMIVAHRHRIELRDHRVAIVLAVWATYTLALGLFNPIVSNASHLGGLLGGLVLGWFLPAALLTDRRELATRPTTRVLTALAIVALLITTVLFLPHLA
jgi:rhomboid protease GluP